MPNPPIKRRNAVRTLKKKGFHPRQRSSSTKHLVFLLLNEEGQDTGMKISIINPHSGPKGDVTEKIVKQWSKKLGIFDVGWMYLFMDCTKSHQDMLNLLRSKDQI